MKQVEEIDLEKRKIEAKYISPLKKTFRHMAEDAKALYLKDKRVDAKQLAKNYNPEFLKTIRDMQRETIKYFGFDIRENNNEKGFKVEKHKALFDYQVETKDVDFILDPIPTEKVNRDFALDATLFVANTSEQQAGFIEETNIKEISEAEKLAVILFFDEEKEKIGQINSLRQEIQKVEFEEMLGGSRSIAEARKKKLQSQLASAELDLAKFSANKDQFIADNIQKGIEAKAASRSELIASQNVGMAESWARQREAELVDGAFPEELVKDYVAILDGHTRPSHVEADFNPSNKNVPVEGWFMIGGFKAKMPRDPSLPISETANCRCQASYRWKQG